MGISAIMQENKDFKKPRIEEGIYHAVLKEVKQISDGKWGQRIAWVCEIMAMPGTPSIKQVELSKVTYNKLSSGNKESSAMECVRAFGGVYEKGKVFEYDSLLGKSARAWVEDYDIQEGDFVGQKASTITKFKPLLGEE